MTFTNVYELDGDEVEKGMDFLNDNIFNQIGTMMKDVATNFMKQTFEVVINAPGFGKNENTNQKKLATEEAIQNLEKAREAFEEEALKFFGENVVHIEIVREDGQLEKAFFPILPFCHALKMAIFFSFFY